MTASSPLSGAGSSLKARRAENLLQRAEKAATASGYRYRGALQPGDAWKLLQDRPDAVLLDVRVPQELHFVGHVPGSVNVPYKFFPGWNLNHDFVRQVRAAARPDQLLLVICRSGVRSHDAATVLANSGFTACINVLEGFEGELNADKQRRVNGWKVCGLPWQQG